jgi:chromosome segregation ATPase
MTFKVLNPLCPYKPVDILFVVELDEKTKAMLKLVEEDADSFAQRAEMYYKKRPELISMVEEFYRAHRSLAERYDQLKSDSGTRLVTTLGSPFSSTKTRLEKLKSMTDQTDDNYSETSNPEESVESEVDDPEQEDETQDDQKMKEEEIPSRASNDEVRKLTEEIERLKEKNRIQKDELVQKDEEKREVIRQLSLAVDVLKDENVRLRKCLARGSSDPKKRILFDFNKFKEAFLGNLFSGSSKLSVVAL